MVDQFIAWFESNKQLRDRVDTKVERIEYAGRTSANATLETNFVLANITVWDIGALDVDVLMKESGEDALAERYDFETSEEMLSVLEGLCQRITDLKTTHK